MSAGEVSEAHCVRAVWHVDRVGPVRLREYGGEVAGAGIVGADADIPDECRAIHISDSAADVVPGLHCHIDRPDVGIRHRDPVIPCCFCPIGLGSGNIILPG